VLQSAYDQTDAFFRSGQIQNFCAAGSPCKGM
jgi:hypothetical protein